MKAEDTREWQPLDQYAYRYERAVKLGLNEPLARDFAEATNIPVWKLRDLIERDCPPDVALDILS